MDLTHETVLSLRPLSKVAENGVADRVTGIEILGDHHVRLSLTEPFAPFLGLLCMVVQDASTSGEQLGIDNARRLRYIL